MFYTYEVLTGIANKKVLGNGITSNEVSHKKLKGVYLITSSREGNIIEFYLEKEKVYEAPDTYANLSSDNPKQFVNLDIEIPVGQRFVPCLVCGGTATSITILYAYEEIR